MNGRLSLRLVIVLLGILLFTLFTGCQRVSEPWDTTDYFKEERTRTAEQQKALQHRLASIQESGNEPWLHTQH